MHDLLTDPLIGVRTSQGERLVALPELLAALSAGTVEGYTGLRAHQADAWHVFLVQLAASVLARSRSEDLPADAAYWRHGLIDLADGQESAWHLVIDDVTKPAFLQHPWKSWEAESADYGVRRKGGTFVYQPKAATPDELDVLVTSKNHDVKMARVSPDAWEAWIYALVLLQTTSGFLGQGNYGIVRMNGGFASRPIVSWVRSLQPSLRFRDEVLALQKLRSSVCDAFRNAQRGIVLTWLTHWDRSKHQHMLPQLEPWFIEAARPVRLRKIENGSIVALGATSRARQIGPKTVDSGDVGDPWIPLNVQNNRKGRSALTLSADGFTPQRLTQLLFEQGYELTPLQRPQPGDEPGWFVASCLVRGQGTTDGFHSVALLVPGKARMALLNKQSSDSLGQFAQKLLTDAKDVQRALNFSLTVLAEGGPEAADFDRDAVQLWVDSARADFVRHWEATYFPTLWRGTDEAHEALRTEWQQFLVNLAGALLEEATQRLPLPTNRTWRAITRAHGALRASLSARSLPLPSRGPMPSTEMEDTTP
jgi:CRISPR system Cascade subunit CasA